MSGKKSVLFVCTGNTCRSPMAEYLFRKAVENRSDFEVTSAGVSAYEGGSMSSQTANVLKERGIEISGFASKPVSQKLVEDATHVFTMTESHLRALLSQFPEHEDKYYLACEFVDLPGQGIGCDVPDPIGMGSAAYNEVAKTLDLAIPRLIEYIDQTWDS